MTQVLTGAPIEFGLCALASLTAECHYNVWLLIEKFMDSKGELCGKGVLSSIMPLCKSSWTALIHAADWSSDKDSHNDRRGLGQGCLMGEVTEKSNSIWKSKYFKIPRYQLNQVEVSKSYMFFDVWTSSHLHRLQYFKLFNSTPVLFVSGQAVFIGFSNVMWDVLLHMCCLLVDE